MKFMFELYVFKPNVFWHVLFDICPLDPYLDSEAKMLRIKRIRILNSGFIVFCKIPLLFGERCLWSEDTDLKKITSFVLSVKITMVEGYYKRKRKITIVDFCAHCAA